MAGLLNTATARGPMPGASPMPGAAPGASPAPQGADTAQGAAPEPGADTAQGAAPNVSPEEQQAYNQFVTNGMKLMYSDQVMPKVLERIKGNGNPIEGLAGATVMLVSRLDDSAQAQGQAIDADVKFQGASELMEQLAELAQTAGIHEYAPEEIEAAVYLALDTYRALRQQQGRLDMGAINEDMRTLVQADQAGRLGELLPGVERGAADLPHPGTAQATGAAPGMPVPAGG